jgi:hypothetical protein
MSEYTSPKIIINSRMNGINVGDNLIASIPKRTLLMIKMSNSRSSQGVITELDMDINLHVSRIANCGDHTIILYLANIDFRIIKNLPPDCEQNSVETYLTIKRDEDTKKLKFASWNWYISCFVSNTIVGFTSYKNDD